MQPTAPDRDDRLADSAFQTPSADETPLNDAFELWRDLGGSD